MLDEASTLAGTGFEVAVEDFYLTQKSERPWGCGQSIGLAVTFDNGAEFSHHQQLHTNLRMQTYFRDTQAPWQKGGIENAIGRLRRLLPRKTPPSRLTQSSVDALAHRQNHTPRKCLGFQTPAEIFSSLLLHLKCESTPRLRSG